MRVIIDGNGFAFRPMVSTREQLINVDGQNVTVIHGVISMILSFIKENDVDEITFCWDFGKSKARASLFPEYKANREETEVSKTVRNQIPILKDNLSAFGFKQVSFPNIEADDIISVIAKALSVNNIDVMIVSSDKDMLQTINGYCQIYSPAKGKNITYINFENVIGMPQKSFVDYLCLLGDDSDNIKGIKGIGEVTAKKLLQKYGTYENILKNEDEIRMQANVKNKDKALANKALQIFTQEGKEIFERNRKLISFDMLLSYEEKKKILESYCYQDLIIDEDAIAKFFKKYHMIEYLRNISNIISCLSNMRKAKIKTQ